MLGVIEVPIHIVPACLQPHLPPAIPEILFLAAAAAAALLLRLLLLSHTLAGWPEQLLGRLCYRPAAGPPRADQVRPG